MLKARNIYFLLIVLLLTAFLLNLFIPISFYVYAGIMVLIIAFLVYGSFNIKADFFAKSYHTPAHNRQEIAITFDDGPTEFTTEVLDLLKEFNAKATFFCIGKRIEKNPEILERISQEEHVIGNHTYSHSNFFPFFKQKRMKAELSKTSVLISEITDKPVEFFRPPFGVVNTTIVKAAKSNNLKIVGWNLRSYDGVKFDTKRILQRIIPNIKPGTVLLLHDSRPDSGIILREVLEEIMRKKLKAVTVNEIFNLDESN